MNPLPKVAFHTLGCKLNFAETSTIGRLFQDAGYARVSEQEQPDVVVINTCSVTDQADKKCRNLVSRAKRHNPDSFVVVVGCYAQLKPQEIAEIPGVNLVLGANEKFDIVAEVERNKSSEGVVLRGEIKEVKHFVPGFSSGDRTRTFLKVQDGCNYFCSFCTIPLARGRSRSGTIAQTLERAQEAAQRGAREIVLTGVNIGDFGQGTSETFFDLVRALDEQITDVERFRISSIEPNLLSNEIIDFVAQSRAFMPHFHIPLQSGSDTVLARMRRRYDVALYASRVEHIVRAMPHCAIGVDVITGFPGETDEEFERTFNFLSTLPVSYLHVFTYSERANTTAVRMDQVVPLAVRQTRTRQLRELSVNLHRQFAQRFENEQMPVLFEQENKEGFMEGYTPNYLRVSAPYNAGLVNSIAPVSLGRLNSELQIPAELRA